MIKFERIFDNDMSPSLILVGSLLFLNTRNSFSHHHHLIPALFLYQVIDIKMFEPALYSFSPQSNNLSSWVKWLFDSTPKYLEVPLEKI